MAILLFNRREVDTIVRWARKNGRPIELVHDEGVYLLAGFGGGQKCQKETRSGRPACKVAYASCCDPTKKPRGVVWDASREVVGGDDFVARIDPSEFVASSNPYVRMYFDPRTKAAHTKEAVQDAARLRLLALNGRSARRALRKRGS